MLPESQFFLEAFFFNKYSKDSLLTLKKIQKAVPLLFIKITIFAV